MVKNKKSNFVYELLFYMLVFMIILAYCYSFYTGKINSYYISKSQNDLELELENICFLISKDFIEFENLIQNNSIESYFEIKKQVNTYKNFEIRVFDEKTKNLIYEKNNQNSNIKSLSKKCFFTNNSKILSIIIKEVS